ncbi:MAG: hypothetical protein KVP17_000551 [Porospora cf. gigantea B]|uniref:uncharacterized protein n=1 Tax=Porospora cf. gigantea B TaxID=2853592 RepID=UPI003571D7C2|nr:MAG: hypothetical protein KVP17_000551 [Porospora cf. gigantea B]
MGSMSYTHLDPNPHSESSPPVPAASEFHIGVRKPYNRTHLEPNEVYLEILRPTEADLRPPNVEREDRPPRKRRRRRRRVREEGSRPEITLTGEVTLEAKAFTHFNQMRQEEERSKQKEQRKKPQKKIKDIGLPTKVQRVTHITADDPRLQELLTMNSDDPRALQILGGE